MDNLQNIQNLIYEVRGVKVMLDKDLAGLYHVTTGNLNKAVKRNIRRFPSDFMFQLTKEEWDSLRFQIGILEVGRGKYTKFLPYALLAGPTGAIHLKRSLKGLACRTNRGYPSEAEFKSASILIGHLPIQTGLLPYIGSFHAAKIGIFQLSSNFSPFISVFTPKSVSFQTFLFPIGTGPRGYHLGLSERKQHFSLVISWN